MQLADHYQGHFRSLATGWQGDDYLEQRRQALAGLLEQGFPGRSREEWRFTDVTPIAGCPFEPVTAAEGSYARPAVAETAAPRCHLLCFTNGIAQAAAAPPALPDGAVLSGYRDSPQALPPAARASFAAETDDGFLLMNAAFLGGGACLYVPPGCRLTVPVHLDFGFTQETTPRAYNLRNVLVLGEGAEAEVIERYHCRERDLQDGARADLWNVVTRVALAPGATLQHSQSVSCGRAAYPLISVQASQQADSRYRAHVLGRAAPLGRQEFRVTLCGVDADAQLDCLHVLDGASHLEYRALIEHAAPRTSGLQMYRGLMDGRSRGVYNGRVRVCAGAENADARQDSAALLLSAGACADASPTLELYTDAVKCSHGATVGRFDEDMLFYLQSRALNRQQAEALLRRAFAEAVLERLPQATRAVLAAADPQWQPELLHHAENS